MPEHNSLVLLTLSKLEYSEASEEFQDAIKKLSDFGDDEIKELTTHIKDHRVGRALKYISRSKLANFIPNLLAMLKDINWPAALGVAEILVSMENMVTPYIKSVFQESDTIWQDWIIRYIVIKWDSNLVNDLKSSLIDLAGRYNYDSGVSALIVLFEKDLLNIESLYSLIEQNRNILETCLGLIKEESDWKYVEQIENAISRYS